VDRDGGDRAGGGRHPCHGGRRPARRALAAFAPALARYATVGDYPIASRVGTVTGEAQGRAHDPDLAYSFGLPRIADGVEALRRRTRRA
jgi:hypothetical protein